MSAGGNCLINYYYKTDLLNFSTLNKQIYNIYPKSYWYLSNIMIKSAWRALDNYLIKTSSVFFYLKSLLFCFLSFWSFILDKYIICNNDIIYRLLVFIYFYQVLILHNVCKSYILPGYTVSSRLFIHISFFI